MSGGWCSVIPVVALSDEAMTPGLYRMLGALAAATGPDGTVGESSYRLALILGVTRQSVSEAVVTLGRLGYVSIESHGAGKRPTVRVITSPSIPAERVRVVPDGSEKATVSQSGDVRVTPDGLGGHSEGSLPVPISKPSGDQKTADAHKSETVRHNPHPPSTPARARDNELSLKERINGAVTPAEAATADPTGGHVPAAAASVTFGKLPDRERATAERIATTLYNTAGVAWSDLSDSMQRREIVIAHDLATKGANPAEAAAFVAWCQADAHRPTVSSMRTYEAHRASFRVQTGSRSATATGELGNGISIE